MPEQSTPITVTERWFSPTHLDIITLASELNKRSPLPNTDVSQFFRAATEAVVYSKLKALPQSNQASS